MGFSEALRLIVEADTGQAVAAVKRLGDTSEKELKRSEQSLDKWGNRLSSLGTGMVTFGVAALAGLGAMAKASEDAQLSVLKLENTIGNMPKLAGESSKQFTDLADSIQGVTAADGDAIVEAEALLGTFNLTADEIKNVTPLVVDYARKFGVDIPDAAIQVGKALDGQVGALKRNGVSIDEVLFKTDRYRAVSEALSKQVGGFAEAEGKTFAGSLARMKNELGDLAEGVGGGAVDAFTKLFGVVDKGAGALESISPGAQNLIGQIATFGAVGLTAAGGISLLVGQAIKARDNFSSLASGVSSLTGKIGGIKVAAGVAAGAAGLAGLALTMKAVADAAADRNLDRFVDSLNSVSDSADDANMKFVELAIAWGNVNEGFDDVLAKSVPAAENFMRLAEAAGANEKELDGMRRALEEKKQADIGGAAAQSEYTDEVQVGADAAGEAEAATRNLTSAIEAHADALAAQFDPLFGMISAMQSQRDAAQKTAEAQDELNKAIQGGDPAAIAAATQDYNDSLIDAGKSAFDVQQAQLKLNDSIQSGDTDLASAQQQMFNWMIQAGFTADQAQFAADNLANMGTQARIAGEQDPVVSASITGVGPVTGDLNALKAKLDAIPREVNIVTRMTQILTGSTNIPLKAAGGPVTAGQPYIVGEHHAELFVPDRNGMIVPNVPVPMQMGSGSGGGGGGGMVTLRFDSGSNPVDRALMEIFRRNIRIEHGGNVQAALGFDR